ncbi:uncharacterized protein LOC116252434 [Nymphaea colorata]|nr:uncharacterized protein LOC116252434 [Nymphaea colorata]
MQKFGWGTPIGCSRQGSRSDFAGKMRGKVNELADEWCTSEWWIRGFHLVLRVMKANKEKWQTSSNHDIKQMADVATLIEYEKPNMGDYLWLQGLVHYCSFPELLSRKLSLLIGWIIIIQSD